MSCTILLTASTLFAGFSQNFHQHLAARCLQGLAVSVCASTDFLMIIDLTFIHMRPHALAAFLSLCAILSNVLLTMTTSLASAAGSWRGFYWF
jgi:MFS family permease